MKDRIDWYQHDVNADAHWKFKALRRKYDWAGEGKFWALNNRIGKSRNCMLDLNNEDKLRETAADLDFEPEELMEFVLYLRDKCQLVTFDGGFVMTDQTQQDLGRSLAKRERDRNQKAEKKNSPANSEDSPSNSGSRKTGQKSGSSGGNGGLRAVPDSPSTSEISQANSGNSPAKLAAEKNAQSVEGQQLQGNSLPNSTNSATEKQHNTVQYLGNNTLSNPSDSPSSNEKKNSSNKGESKPESVTNQTAEKGIVAPPPQPAGMRLVEKSIHRHGSEPICLSFHLDDSYLSREILGFLSGAIEVCLMQGDLMSRPAGFLKFLIEHFIRETQAKGLDLTAGRLRIEFASLVTYRLKQVEKLFDESSKTDQWFEQQLKKLPAEWPEAEKEKFRLHYGSQQPSGKRYYQTVNNFVIENAIDTWSGNNAKGERNSHTAKSGKQNSNDKSNNPVHTGFKSQDDINAYYLNGGAAKK